MNILPFDWTLIRTFLAVADTGSYSGAARALGSSQPTVGRQVQLLEDQCGVTLFQRRSRGMEPTATARDMLAAARRMQAAAADLGLAAAGAETGLAGTVRITASVFTAQRHLPRILAGLRRDAPAIQIDLVASDETDNLLFREADIALRMYRPRQLDMVTRHLGNLEMGIFAARSFVARAGPITDISRLMEHEVLGLDRSERLIEAMRDYGLPVSRDDFPLRCDDNAAYYEMIRAGCGIGFAQKATGRADPDMVELFPEMPLPAMEVWLTSHEAVRHTPRVRRVWDALAAGLAPVLVRPSVAAGATGA